MRAGPLMGALPAAALSQAGCVERFLAIHSDPPGAAVYLDGEKVGTTPCEVTYTWYGTRDPRPRAPGSPWSASRSSLTRPGGRSSPSTSSPTCHPLDAPRPHGRLLHPGTAPVSREEVHAVLRTADELRKKADPPARLPSPDPPTMPCR